MVLCMCCCCCLFVFICFNFSIQREKKKCQKFDHIAQYQMHEFWWYIWNVRGCTISLSAFNIEKPISIMDIGNHSNVLVNLEKCMRSHNGVKHPIIIRKNPFEHSRCSGACKIHIELQKQTNKMKMAKLTERKRWRFRKEIK